MPTKRQVLEQLRRDELLAAVDRFGLVVLDRRLREPVVDVLATEQRACIGEILADIPRVRLKELCRSFGLDDGGTKKALLIERLGGKPVAPAPVPPAAAGVTEPESTSRHLAPSEEIPEVPRVFADAVAIRHTPREGKIFHARHRLYLDENVKPPPEPRLDTDGTVSLDDDNQGRHQPFLRKYLRVFAQAAKRATKLERPPQEAPSYVPEEAVSALAGGFAASLMITLISSVVGGVLLARGAAWSSLIFNPDTGRIFRLGPMAFAEMPMDATRLTLMITALGLLYGLVGSIGLPLVATSVWVELIITANGLYFGYLSTAWLAAKSHFLPPQEFLFDLFYMKLLYIMLGYYLIIFLPGLITAHSEGRLKYEYLLGGGYGLFGGWVLSQGSSSEAIVFSGTLLLLVTFVTLSVAETMTLWIFAFLSELFGSSLQSLWPYLTEERALPKPLFPAIRRAYSEDRPSFSIAFWVTALFPVLVLILFLSYAWVRYW